MQIEIRQLRKSFAGKHVLEVGAFAVDFAQCLAVIGPSGGGKSTLLRVLAGLEMFETGEVWMDGTLLPTAKQQLLAYRRSIGVVFQTFNLFPNLSALDNVLLPLQHVHGLPQAAARQRAMETLNRFGLIAHAHKRPLELSGGQRQRVAIARAVAIRPRFFLLDEPTSSLDPEMTAEVLDLVDELRREARPLILVTHEIGFARQSADHIAFLQDGRILAHANAKEFFASPPIAEVKRFLDKTLRFS